MAVQTQFPSREGAFSRAALILACLLFLAPAWGQGKAQAQTAAEFAKLRDKLVQEDVIGGGIKNEKVIGSIRSTLRHEFVPIKDRPLSYVDMALPIGEQQTISPPFVVAYMTEALDPISSDRVLEIGTGSGYQAAVLSPLVKEVYTIEIVELLGRKAEKTLAKLGYKNVFCKVGDGFLGWPQKAPFDKIIVTCSPENVPVPLVEQLKEGGRMVIPLGERFQQSMTLLVKKDGKLVRESLRPTLFVPMTGRAETLRKIQPDPLHPGIQNGSFEEMEKGTGDESFLVGWHYLRHGKVEEDPKAPDGTHVIVFRNDIPGRLANAVQGFAVDGRKIKQLAASAKVRTKDVRAGRKTDQLPMLFVTFYDDDRALVGEDWLGPWFDTNDWGRKEGTLVVPIKARSAIVQVGLLGGLGEVAFDDVKIWAPGADEKFPEKEQPKPKGVSNSK